jgi:hypothetical protein
MEKCMENLKAFEVSLKGIQLFWRFSVCSGTIVTDSENKSMPGNTPK